MFINDVTAIDGIDGACLLSRKGGSILENISSLLHDELERVIAPNVFKMEEMASAAGLPVLHSYFYFNKYQIVAIPLVDDVLLLLVCDDKSTCRSSVARTMKIVEQLDDEEKLAVAEMIEQDDSGGKEKKGLLKKIFG